MAEYTFLLQHNPLPVDRPIFCQPGFLFNEYRHLHQQSGGEFYLLSALNLATRQAEARCAFFIRQDEAVSPYSAPFGSIEFVDSLSDAVLDDFLFSLIQTARRLGASVMRLRHYPHCYAPQQTERLVAMATKHHFRLVENNTAFFLPITPIDAFDTIITPAERRRLRKCRAAGFQFIHWQTPDINEVTNFIRRTRQQQGYPLTIAPGQLIHLLHKFPNEFPVFGIIDGSQLTAIAIAVHVRHDILYNFLPASDSAYSTFSPMVMLMDGMYGFCQQQHINLFDLGVSLDADKRPKPGLMRFKRSLGAQESPKFTFEKML